MAKGSSAGTTKKASEKVKDSPADKAGTKKRSAGKKNEAKEEGRTKKGKQAASSKEAQVVRMLIDGDVGTKSPRPMPLSALTKHRAVAWQWMEGGKMQYPIPIGCSKPLSPFNSEDD
eukprot:TRINITY_DN115492_c0_g1_i1.p1 TRINITY_DN115492_c0_g1~~TRINITY_DN115492_c0_g1_i1.p1  ORF type:complete len:117 (-),score=27.22 TRINITY_DN115492_c0_g1_i1:237-587(-)